jgi:hypothetical protein
MNASPAFRPPRLEATLHTPRIFPTYWGGHSTPFCSYINLHVVDLHTIHLGTTPPKFGRPSAI